MASLAAVLRPNVMAKSELHGQRLRTTEPVYGFRIGENRALAIECGAMEFRPEQPMIAAEASASEFSAALGATSANGLLRLPFNVLLLEWGGEYVLIDTGEPGYNGELPPLHKRLRALGIEPEEIAHVILTHAHFDHTGGLLDDAGHPRFSRAQHHVSRAEAEFWTAPEPDVSRMRMDATDMIRSARRVFESIPFTYAESDCEILPGVRTFLSPGHTPGHMTLRLTSGSSTLYHIADLTHHGRFLLEHPTWSIGSDVDPGLAVRTREAIFSALAASRERVFGFHLPFPGLGHVLQSPAGIRWVAEDWRTE